MTGMLHHYKYDISDTCHQLFHLLPLEGYRLKIEFHDDPHPDCENTVASTVTSFGYSEITIHFYKNFKELYEKRDIFEIRHVICHEFAHILIHDLEHIAKNNTSEDARHLVTGFVEMTCERLARIFTESDRYQGVFEEIGNRFTTAFQDEIEGANIGMEANK